MFWPELVLEEVPPDFLAALCRFLWLDRLDFVVFFLALVWSAP